MTSMKAKITGKLGCLSLLHTSPPLTCGSLKELGGWGAGVGGGGGVVAAAYVFLFTISDV